MIEEPSPISSRFRGFLPVVVDCETGGFKPETDALLEIAAVIIDMDGEEWLRPGQTLAYHVVPFEGARMDPESMAINGIDPYHPFRMALEERDALGRLLKQVRLAVKATGCTRAVLVGHNPTFDLGFLNAAVARNDIKRNPFHPFTTFDTATLGGLAYGQTVLARAAAAAGIDWNTREAHSALYDAERTAELFCTVANRWRELGGWVPESGELALNE